MAMIEKWRKFLDMEVHADAPVTELSKAFDCIDRDLLIAKLHAYGFDSDMKEFMLVFCFLPLR